MKKTLFLFAVVLITTSLSITAFSQEKVDYPIQKVELEKKKFIILPPSSFATKRESHIGNRLDYLKIINLAKLNGYKLLKVNDLDIVPSLLKKMTLVVGEVVTIPIEPIEEVYNGVTYVNYKFFTVLVKEDGTSVLEDGIISSDTNSKNNERFIFLLK